MHDIVKWVVGSVICGELRYHEPSQGLIVDDVGAEKHGEYVVQPPTDRVGRTSFCQNTYLLHWKMGKPIWHDCCS